MTSPWKSVVSCVFLAGVVWTAVNADASFVGSSVSSGPGGTRSVLVSGQNGAGGAVTTRFGGSGAGGAVSTRVGGSNIPTGVGIGPGGGTYASAGPAGAYAGPGGAFASAGGGFGNPWGFPYWNGAGSYASAGAPYNYDYPYNYNYDGGYNSGEVGVYAGTNSNGISTRFANLGPGGQATVVEQNGNEAPRVYTYRGSSQSTSG